MDGKNKKNFRPSPVPWFSADEVMKGRLEVLGILEVIESRGQGQVEFLSKCLCGALGPFWKRRARYSNVRKM